MLSIGTLRGALGQVRDRIAASAARSGRPAESVRIMAVTKTFGYEYVQLAMEVGLRLFGENRVQESMEKWSSTPAGVELHLIGHLQRNKARSAVELFDMVQSIDRLETAEALDRRCAEAERSMDVLVEINTSAEESKHGLRAHGALPRLLDDLAALSNVRARGLMTVGPLTPDQAEIRRSFAALYTLYQESRSLRDPAVFDTLSMGMSGDYEIAVEEGATLVRLGTALFGRRDV